VTCSKILEDPATETRISEDEMADYYKYDPVPLFFELLPVEGQTLFLTNPFFFLLFQLRLCACYSGKALPSRNV
jgi:hypothetical protein